VSQHTRWEDGRAIRGGIPVCFPWFRAKPDDPRAPAHGFARTKEWKLESILADDGGSVSVAFSTESDDSTRQLWPYDFHLTYRAIVGRALRLELIAANTGSESIRFEEALHTYFKVGNVEDVVVHGLDHVAYLDNNDCNCQKVQAPELRLNGPTDKAYLEIRNACELTDPVLHRKIRTDKRDSSTTILWNPWWQGAVKLADLGDNEWRQMLCIEASNILASAITLEPGEQHTMSATLSAVAD